MKLNVADLKKMIKECVTELKQQFEHDASKSIAGNKASTPDGADSGDKKMGPVDGTPGQAVVKNAVDKVKEQKGAMQQSTAVGRGYSKVVGNTPAPTKNTVCNVPEQKGAMMERKKQEDDSTKLDETKKIDEAKKMQDEAKKIDQAKKEQDESKKLDEKKVEEKKKLDESKKKKVEQKKKLEEDASLKIPLRGERAEAEVSAQVVPGEQGQPAEVQLVIIDDEVKPEDINREEIQIEIPQGDREEVQVPGGEMGGQMAPVGGEQVPENGGIPGQEGEENEFDRFEDLAGLKDQRHQQ